MAQIDHSRCSSARPKTKTKELERDFYLWRQLSAEESSKQLLIVNNLLCLPIFPGIIYPELIPAGSACQAPETVPTCCKWNVAEVCLTWDHFKMGSTVFISWRKVWAHATGKKTKNRPKQNCSIFNKRQMPRPWWRGGRKQFRRNESQLSFLIRWVHTVWSQCWYWKDWVFPCKERSWQDLIQRLSWVSFRDLMRKVNFPRHILFARFSVLLVVCLLADRWTTTQPALFQQSYFETPTSWTEFKIKNYFLHRNKTCTIQSKWPN